MPLRPPRSRPSVHPWPRKTLRDPRLDTPSVYRLVEAQCEPRIPAALSSQVLQLSQVPARDPHLSDYAEVGA